MPFSELVARYEALPPLNPPRQRNLHAAMEEAQRHEANQNLAPIPPALQRGVYPHVSPVSFLKLYF